MISAPVAFDRPVAFYRIEGKPNALVYKFAFALAFAVATAIAAQIRIPLAFTPVPITLQTLFVFSSGLMLGARFGLLSQAMYLLMILSGVPASSSGATGAAAILGPTGGYLLGFLLFSYVSGQLFYGKNILSRSVWLQMLLLYALSVVCVFIPGVAILKVVRGLTWTDAILLGYAPFIIGDVIKIVLGVKAANLLKGRVDRYLGR